ncbi:MAG: GNAT family N-acetyltransferase [Anaerolineae bacterium]|nr:GNAT family N-acetyltransferase [Anaerolineae bacterium]
MVIRRACPDEAPLLSDLALRSKAYWGYSAEFIAACRDDLTLSEAFIRETEVFVSEDSAGKIAGFYALDRKADGIADLNDLFVDPASIGGGHGRALFEHAIQLARSQGCREMRIDSDPFAEPFYQKMGAERMGEVESTVFPGRMLPLLRVLL